jgi:adenosylcobinamide hydrolase
MFRYDRTDDRLTLRRSGTRWLSTGFDGEPGQAVASGAAGAFGGGFRDADAAHNLTVPEGFERTDLSAYAAERLGGRPGGPTLFTGVSQRHARGARRGPVEAVATVGLSNPAALPVDAGGETAVRDVRPETEGEGSPWRPGTVNVFVGATRALGDGALAGLLATAVEARTATLLVAAGVPGTTSDAVVVGCDPDDEPSPFAGSATEVGGAARACVREAVLASLSSRYAEEDGPPSVEAARHGVVTEESARVFEP